MILILLVTLFILIPKSLRRIETELVDYQSAENKSKVRLDFLHSSTGEPFRRVNGTRWDIYKGRTAKIKNQLPMWRPPALIRNIRNGKECVRCAVCAEPLMCASVCRNREKCSVQILRGYLHFNINSRWSVCSSGADFCSFHFDINSIWTIILWYILRLQLQHWLRQFPFICYCFLYSLGFSHSRVFMP